MVLDFIFPVKCYQCQKNGSYLCSDCLKKVPFLTRQICPQCSQISPWGLIHSECGKDSSLTGLTSYYSYRSIVGRLIRDYKYRPVKKIGPVLADLTIRAARAGDRQLKYWTDQSFVFIPLPLFSAKKLYRGFDQTKEILERTAEVLELDYNDRLLIRHKWTQQQARLDKADRSANVKSAFQLTDKKAAKAGKYVLFDDVWTTGSTMTAAAEVLKSAGAAEIWGLTICR